MILDFLDSRFRGNDWVGGLGIAVGDPGVDMCATRFPHRMIPVKHVPDQIGERGSGRVEA